MEKLYDEKLNFKNQTPNERLIICKFCIFAVDTERFPLTDFAEVGRNKHFNNEGRYIAKANVYFVRHQRIVTERNISILRNFIFIIEFFL